MILRSSMVRDIKTCLAKAAYKYVLGIVPLSKGKGIRNDLDFGKLMHFSIETYHTEGYDKAVRVIEDTIFHETKRKNKHVAKVLLQKYTEKTTVEMISLEKPFRFKIGSHTWEGRFDGIGRFNGKLWVIEHKTTNPFYLQTKPNDQFIAYWLGAKVYYRQVSGVLINNLDCDKLEVNIIPVTFSDVEKDEWIDEMKMTAEHYKRCLTKGIFPRNEASCYMYNSMCPYLPLCSEPEGPREMVQSRCYEVNEKLKNLAW
jgi:hypothetical protein